MPEEIKPANQFKFEHYDASGWQFNHCVSGMSTEKEMDQASDKVGIQGLPSVFYGNNHFYVSNKDFNILLDFNAIDSLSYSGFEKRKQFLRNKTEEGKDDELVQSMEQLMLTHSGLSKNEMDLNLIDVNPKDIVVQQADHWKKKDTSKIKDYREFEKTSDWTYSTPYKGTLRYLSDAAKHIKEETGLDLPVQSLEKNLSCEFPEESSINFGMLSPENPILHFGEIYLFECDLDDCGYTMNKIRFRVMKDCFYILLRFFLRVDGVRVRIFDTRIFHEFGTDNIHREF